MISGRTVNICLFIIVMYVLGVLISKEYADLKIKQFKKQDKAGPEPTPRPAPQPEPAQPSVQYTPEFEDIVREGKGAIEKL